MRVRGSVVVVAVVLSAGALFAAPIPHPAAADRAGLCAARAASSAARAQIVTGHGTRVAVIGDSYAQGSGLGDIGRSWPSALAGRVTVDGFRGSGFTVDAGGCPGVAYADRAAAALARYPEVVVVQGGLNDYPASSAAIASGARQVIARLRGVRVVLVGPALAPSRAAEVPRIDSALARAAAEAGVQYISTKGWPLEYLPDRLHLTEKGHRDFGRRVADQVQLAATPASTPRAGAASG